MSMSPDRARRRPVWRGPNRAKFRRSTLLPRGDVLPAEPRVRLRPPATLMSISSTLCTESLGSVGRGLRLPDYDRNSLTPAVVHIGLGGFHRSHQAVYFDDLASTT